MNNSQTLDMLFAAYAGPHAAKRMARDAGVSPRVTEKWWAALTTPRVDVFLRMVRQNTALRAQMLQAIYGGEFEGTISLAGADVPETGSTVSGQGSTVARSGGTPDGASPPLANDRSNRRRAA